MKILNVHLENFASYKELDFSFNDKGLVLIHGATGSGKSTLCDAIPWTLFGVTSKGGKVDEVLSWAGGVTYGCIELEGGINIYRIRGKGVNDLYYSTAPMQVVRGKDITDTQKLINQLLGMDADLYCSGAYYSEFSQTAQFFTTTAKNRRAITEQLVDLSLAKTLQEKIKVQTKNKHIALNNVEARLHTISSKLETISNMIETTKQQNDSWDHDMLNKVSALQAKADIFEVTKAHRIKELKSKIVTYEVEQLSISELTKEIKETPKTKICKECGMSSDNAERARLETVLQLKERLGYVKQEENVYQTQIQDIKSQTNPHTKNLLKLDKDYTLLSMKKADDVKEQTKTQDDLLNLDLLSDVVDSFRAELVGTTVENLETETNSLLSDYFEGEIRVTFEVTDADKLDVGITKDGNTAAFTQLSKGQRQMLKLCFGVAVMKTAAIRHALDFSQLFYDEATDGLDENNKTRAVRMLETLALKAGSVYLVDHSEALKSMINTKYKVELTNGRSQIN